MISFLSYSAHLSLFFYQLFRDVSLIKFQHKRLGLQNTPTASIQKGNTSSNCNTNGIYVL